ncbi:MAG: 3'(2'),5'-bisphosphate nucleotidase CysQ [Bacteroidota bacterium]
MLNEKDCQFLLEELAKIAKAAGQAIMEIYSDDQGIGVEYKADDSPLTRADRAANTIICDQLEQLRLKFPIISEENKAIPYEQRRDYAYCWMVDPLDGTKEFIKRNGEFTVNIALIHQQRSILGVVYVPETKALYWAAKGLGAWMEAAGKREALQAQSFDRNDPALGVVCSRSHLNPPTEAFVNALNEPVLVAKGSSLKFLVIARGQAHLYPRLAPTMEWDTAAAQIILEEAGGEVLRHEDQQPLIYNKPDLLNPHFVAAARRAQA